MRGRNGTWHRYYYCRNHDPLRAGGEYRRCPERNIRADALDAFVFDHIRAAITHPDQLLAGEQAVTADTPRSPTTNSCSAELARLDRKIEAADTERRRLIDLYQGGFIELPEMQRRATEVSSRRKELQHKRTSLADERTALARDNQLRRRVHDFAARIHAVIDTLDDTQKQQLLRLLIEDVRVTGWHVQIRLRIALDPPPPATRPARTSKPPPHPRPVSSQDGLRSVSDDRRGGLPPEFRAAQLLPHHEPAVAISMLFTIAAALTLGPALLTVGSLFGLFDPRRLVTAHLCRRIGASEMLMVESDHDMRNSADFISLDRVAKSSFDFPASRWCRASPGPPGPTTGHATLPYPFTTLGSGSGRQLPFAEQQNANTDKRAQIEADSVRS